MILIVGGTGKLGRHLTHRLLGNGARVRVMTRDPSRARALLHAGAEVVTGDLLDQESVKHAMHGVRTVISSAHSVLGTGRNRSAAVDGTGQRTLIAASESAGVAHFVFVSASGASPASPIDFFRTKAELMRYQSKPNLNRTEQRQRTYPLSRSLYFPSIPGVHGRYRVEYNRPPTLATITRQCEPASGDCRKRPAR